MQDIGQYTGDNIGGIEKFQFIPVDDIVFIPRDSNHIINAGIVLKQGARWSNVYMTEGSFGYKETLKKNAHGNSYNNKLVGFVPKDREDLAELFDEMEGSRYVAIYYDNNGKTKLMGSLESPLQFKADLDTKNKASGLNGHKIIFSGNSRHKSYFFPVGPFDTNAYLYFKSTGIINQTEQNAVDILFRQLKFDGIWDYFKALYLISPTSLSAAAVNARNPGTFDLIFINNPTHSLTGVDFNGTTQYAKTGFITEDHLTLNSFHGFFYSRLDVDESGYSWGSLNTSQQMLIFQIRNGDLTNFYCYNDFSSQGRLFVTQLSSLGGFLGTRTASNDSRVFKNGVEYGNLTNTGGAQPTIEFFLGAYNNAGTPTQFSRKECAFFSIGDGLTPTQALKYYNAVQTYQQNVIPGGRQV